LRRRVDVVTHRKELATMDEWIGVDLDGTLARDDQRDSRDFDLCPIGPPIPLMVDRVKAWLKQGIEVRIFTARANPLDMTPTKFAATQLAIRKWCEEHIGQELVITYEKDYRIKELWDDRAVRVRKNTGEVVG